MVTLVCAIEPVGPYAQGWGLAGGRGTSGFGSWVRAGGTLLGWLVAGTEHWLRFHMLMSLWMVVDSD